MLIMFGIRLFQKAMVKDPVRTTQSVLGALGTLGLLAYAGNECYKVHTDHNIKIAEERVTPIPSVGATPGISIKKIEGKPGEEIPSSIKTPGS